MRKPLDLSVYLVTDPHLCAGLGLVETALAAVHGGASIVQLRDTQAGGRALVEQARALVAALRPLGIPLIVNDRIDVALAADADGVHVGQSDMAPADARALIGPDLILGLSAREPDEIAGADPAVVDYLGIGPIFSVDPRTKPNAAEPLGIGGFAVRRQGTRLPVVAIGGIQEQHVAPLVAVGADGVAVVSAICGQPDPQAAARGLADAVHSVRH
jgi:thiamine-phosphate pyrophosphorylase